MPRKIDLNGNSTSLTIAVSELQSQVNRYKFERHAHILAHIQTDSRAVWISKNKIMEFFSNNPSATGMRIYFSVIEDPYFQQGAHSLIFCGTESNGVANIDLLNSDHWVMIAQNFNFDDLGRGSESAICPPPDPCQGNGLTY